MPERQAKACRQIRRGGLSEAHGASEPRRFGGLFAPRLQVFLRQLHEHRTVEDYHCFPILREADARPARGFDVLDGDHKLIDSLIHDSIEAANALLAALPAARDDMRRAGDRYAEAGDRLIVGLRQHLDDEEDLIVPLILDRGEARLGVH